MMEACKHSYDAICEQMKLVHHYEYVILSPKNFNMSRFLVQLKQHVPPDGKEDIFIEHLGVVNQMKQAQKLSRKKLRDILVSRSLNLLPDPAEKIVLIRMKLKPAAKISSRGTLLGLPSSIKQAAMSQPEHMVADQSPQLESPQLKTVKETSSRKKKINVDYIMKIAEEQYNEIKTKTNSNRISIVHKTFAVIPPTPYSYKRITKSRSIQDNERSEISYRSSEKAKQFITDHGRKAKPIEVVINEAEKKPGNTSPVNLQKVREHYVYRCKRSISAKDTITQETIKSNSNLSHRSKSPSKKSNSKDQVAAQSPKVIKERTSLNHRAENNALQSSQSNSKEQEKEKRRVSIRRITRISSMTLLKEAQESPSAEGVIKPFARIEVENKKQAEATQEGSRLAEVSKVQNAVERRFSRKYEQIKTEGGLLSAQVQSNSSKQQMPAVLARSEKIASNFQILNSKLKSPKNMSVILPNPAAFLQPVRPPGESLNASATNIHQKIEPGHNMASSSLLAVPGSFHHPNVLQGNKGLKFPGKFETSFEGDMDSSYLSDMYQDNSFNLGTSMNLGSLQILKGNPRKVSKFAAS